ncbi:nucleoside diphosphate kinase 6 isoform X2 [Scyliorhinus canicula]|uniref:nucleoside diphosphate kinase 6 isoform X2 n=1 Tax=Scyliorhinus canicula TaxID=7830 RepID=UPI0018F59ADE|nr:nucleoside diphosphate kinase 6 isoform X2 [Scyliorhinus canicula]
MGAPVGHMRPLLQLTLALVKPDAVAHPLILQQNSSSAHPSSCLSVVGADLQEKAEDSIALLTCALPMAVSLWRVRSGPMRAYILAQEDAILRWRQLMGPTRVFRARYSAPESIRGNYGLTDTRNTTHGSDSPESAAKEIPFFFPEFKEQQWFSTQEMSYRQGQYFYHSEKQVHLLRTQPEQLLQSQGH